jgi:hypothetical protein
MLRDASNCVNVEVAFLFAAYELLLVPIQPCKNPQAYNQLDFNFIFF